MASPGNKIKVNRKGIPLSPTAFVFKKKKHQINNILHQWQEYGFESSETEPDWSTGRMRKYFHVETKENRVFEIFQDMKDQSLQQWFLTREIVDEKA